MNFQDTFINNDKILPPLPPTKDNMIMSGTLHNPIFDDAFEIDDYIELLEEKLRNGVFSISKKRGKSRAWEMFGDVVDDKNKVIDGYVACRSCGVIKRYRATVTSNLIQHRCMKHAHRAEIKLSPADKKLLMDAALKWSINNSIPYSVINREDFIEFIDCIVKVHNKIDTPPDLDAIVPQAASVSNEVENLRNKYVVKIIEKLKQIKYLSISIDLWSEDLKGNGWMSLVLHSMEDDNLTQRLLGVRQIYSNTALMNIIRDILLEYNIKNLQAIYFVTDRNVRFIEALKEYNRLNSLTDILDDIILKSFESVGQVTELLSICQSLVSFIKESKFVGNLPTKLCQKIGNQWLTYHEMLKSISENWHEIETKLSNYNKTNLIENIDHADVKALSELLEEFVFANHEIQNTEAPTIHEVYAQYVTLLELCSPNPDDSEMVTEFRSILNSNLIEIWGTNITIEHKVALFLFPLCKSLNNVSNTEKEEIYRFIERNSDIADRSFENSSSSQSPMPNEVTRYMRFFPKFCQDDEQFGNLCKTVRDEIINYINEPIELTDIDLVDWWKKRKSKYKCLYQVFLKVMCIPASSRLLDRQTIITNVILNQKLITTTNNSNQTDGMAVLKSNLETDNVNISSLQTIEFQNQ